MQDQGMEDTNPNRFRRHADTELLIRYLRQSNVGDKLNYESLDNLIGRSCRYGSCLRTACKSLAAEEQIFFIPVRGEGIERVDHKGWLDSEGPKERKRAANSGKRGYRKMSYIVASELPSLEDQGRLAFEQTMLSMHESLGKPKVQEKVGALCQRRGQRALMRDVFDQMKELF